MLTRNRCLLHLFGYFSLSGSQLRHVKLHLPQSLLHLQNILEREKVYFLKENCSIPLYKTKTCTKKPEKFRGTSRNALIFVSLTCGHKSTGQHLPRKIEPSILEHDIFTVKTESYLGLEDRLGIITIFKCLS